MSNVNAVIFDMDGVLIDSEKYLVPCWVRAAREAGFPFEYEHGLFMRSLDYSLAEKEMKKIFGDEFDYVELRKVRQKYVEEYFNKYGIEKKPGADELLDYLKERGIKRIVATASSAEIAKERLARVGLLDKLDEVVSALMVPHGKPAPDIYLYACSEAGELPQDCMAVEDSPNGVRSASAAGLRTIMVPDLTPADEELEKLYYKKADTLADVKQIIMSDIG